VAVRVGHGRAPEIVGGHQRQRTGAQHVGVHRHGRYVVVHEIAAQPVPVAHGDGRGHGRVHDDRDVGPPVLFLAAAQVVVHLLVVVVVQLLVVLLVLVLLLLLVVMVVWRAPHRTIPCLVQSGGGSGGRIRKKTTTTTVIGFRVRLLQISLRTDGAAHVRRRRRRGHHVQRFGDGRERRRRRGRVPPTVYRSSHRGTDY